MTSKYSSRDIWGFTASHRYTAVFGPAEGKASFAKQFSWKCPARLHIHLTPIDGNMTPIDRNLIPIDRNLTLIDRNLTPIDRNLTWIDRNLTLIDRNLTSIDRIPFPVSDMTYLNQGLRAHRKISLFYVLLSWVLFPFYNAEMIHVISTCSVILNFWIQNRYIYFYLCS